VNILVVSSKYPPEYSGSGLRCHNTYLRLKEKYGVNYKILTSSVTENKNSEYKIDGVNVKRVSFKPFHSSSFINYRSGNKLIDLFSIFIGKVFYRLDYFTEASLTLVYLIRLSRWYDLIHVFGNVNVTAATLTFAKIFNKKVIYEVVNFYNNKDYDPLAYYEPFFIKMLFGKEFRRDWQVVAISKMLEELCQRHNPDVRIIHRPNPVNELKFHPVLEPVKINLRKKLTKFSEDDNLIINMSKFMPLKNQILLIEVLQQLPENYKLLMIGPLVDNGPLAKRDIAYFNKIKNLVYSLNLEGRVQLKTGFFDNVEEYFQLADVFAFPTTDEALGTPMLESLSCAVPVVMTRIKSVSDVWIKNGINGYLCNLNVEDFVSKILLSEKISKKSLVDNSESLLKVASTHVIDEEYNDLFKNFK